MYAHTLVRMIQNALESKINQQDLPFVFTEREDKNRPPLLFVPGNPNERRL